MRPAARAIGWLAVLAALAAVPGAPAAAAPGVVERRVLADGYSSITYVPSTVDRSRPAPLLVVLHACNQTAEWLQGSGDFDAEAERQGFVVLYADFDPLQRPLWCWRTQSDVRRAGADPAAIAAMVRDAVARQTPRIDAARVYVAGMSSGAMMATVLGATYPDRFAAIAVSAGCAYRARTCVHAAPSGHALALARAVVRAMGPRRRVLPVLVVHGDRDAVVPFAHSRQIVDQWRVAGTLIASGTPRRPIAARPVGVRSATAAGDRSATVESYADQRGRTVIERWTVHGLDHHDGASPALVWAFFRQFRNAGSAR